MRAPELPRASPSDLSQHEAGLTHCDAQPAAGAVPTGTSPPKAKWLNSRQQPSTGVVGGSNPSVATHFRCWEGLGDGFGVVCHHPACTGAFPGCKLLPSKESPSVLGDGVIPFRGVV